MLVGVIGFSSYTPSSFIFFSANCTRTNNGSDPMIRTTPNVICGKTCWTRPITNSTPPPNSSSNAVIFDAFLTFARVFCLAFVFCMSCMIDSYIYEYLIIVILLYSVNVGLPCQKKQQQ